MIWKTYYYRVSGYALTGAGAGLVLDELIHGPFNLNPGNHELYGLIMIVIGLVLITRKPHGK